MGQYDKAIEYYEKALEIVKKTGLSHRVAIIEEQLKKARREKAANKHEGIITQTLSDRQCQISNAVYLR